MNESLNIRENIKILVLKALNKTGSATRAAPLLGRTPRGVAFLMNEFNIIKTGHKKYDVRIN